MTRTDVSGEEAARLEGDDKRRFVAGMFDRIAPRYDALNTVISGGADRWFRKRLVRSLELGPAARVLDVGCGTGAVGEAVRTHGPDDARVVGVDLAAEMLELGRDKHPKTAFVAADGLRLPVASATMDAAVCAFVFRNVPDIPGLVAEMARTLADGGRFGALEIGRGEGSVWGPIYRTWFFKIMPRLAGPLSGDREAYRYLAETVRNAPEPDEIVGWMGKAGLRDASAEPIMGGAIHLYTGRA